MRLLVLVEVGATPVLIDSDDRYQIDVSKIIENINSNTKAIVPVHWEVHLQIWKKL